MPYALTLNGGRLPFGCHAWARFRDAWRPAFAQAGLII
jgi:hypothetical protein